MLLHTYSDSCLLFHNTKQYLKEQTLESAEKEKSTLDKSA